MQNGVPEAHGSKAPRSWLYLEGAGRAEASSWRRHHSLFQSAGGPSPKAVSLTFSIRVSSVGA